MIVPPTAAQKMKIAVMFGHLLCPGVFKRFIRSEAPGLVPSPRE